MTIKKHYRDTGKLLQRLDSLVETTDMELAKKNVSIPDASTPNFDPQAKTAILMVNGFNGLGLHTLFNVIRFFGKEFRNFVFVQIGVIDAGNFKGAPEVSLLKEDIEKESNRYVTFMRQQGYYAKGFTFVGVDVIDEIEKIGPEISQRYSGAVFFGGQLVFAKETIFTKWLHNYTVFAMQRKFYNQGIPFVVLPIRV